MSRQAAFDFLSTPAAGAADLPASTQAFDRARLRKIVAECREDLRRKTEARIKEMREDDTSHHMLYQALGVAPDRGREIDEFQNIGRLLNNNAGGLLERLARLCIVHRYPAAGRLLVPNAVAKSPRHFEIDCLAGKDAFEIKWRDATTDGDHIKKEEARLRSIVAAGYRPVRVMFFSPNREQAIKVQGKLADLYRRIDGAYYAGQDAWDFITSFTGVDLEAELKAVSCDPGAADMKGSTRPRV